MTNPAPNRTERFIAYFEQACNRQDPQPPHSLTPNSVIDKTTRSMETKTWEEVKNLCKSMHPPIFVLSQDQLRTLNSLNIPAGYKSAIENLSHLFMPPQNYSLVQRLKSIATIAPTGAHPTDRPNWSQWWLSQPNKKAGVPRPQDHDPLKEPDQEVLNRVIAAMTEQALTQLPSDQEIIRHLQQLQNTAKKASRPAHSNQKNEPLLISSIITLAETTRTTSQYFLSSTQAFDQAVSEADSERSFLKNCANPNLIAQKLQAMGHPTKPDCGLKEDLQQLKQAVTEHGLDNIDIDHAHQFWILSANSQEFNAVFNRENNSHTIGGPNNATNHRSDQYNLSPEEQHLIYMSAPKDPTVDLALPRPEHPAHKTAHLALLHQTTPDKMYRFLTDQDQELDRPQVNLCSYRTNCPTRCAVHQLDTENSPETRRPLTTDGNPESCAYFIFLQQNSQLTPALRQINAKQKINLIIEQYKARNRKLHREEQEDQEFTDEAEADDPEQDPNNPNPDGRAAPPAKAEPKNKQLSFL